MSHFDLKSVTAVNMPENLEKSHYTNEWALAGKDYKDRIKQADTEDEKREVLQEHYDQVLERAIWKAEDVFAESREGYSDISYEEVIKKVYDDLRGKGSFLTKEQRAIFEQELTNFFHNREQVLKSCIEMGKVFGYEDKVQPWKVLEENELAQQFFLQNIKSWHPDAFDRQISLNPKDYRFDFSQFPFLVVEFKNINDYKKITQEALHGPLESVAVTSVEGLFDASDSLLLQVFNKHVVLMNQYVYGVNPEIHEVQHKITQNHLKKYIEANYRNLSELTSYIKEGHQSFREEEIFQQAHGHPDLVRQYKYDPAWRQCKSELFRLAHAEGVDFQKLYLKTGTSKSMSDLVAKLQRNETNFSKDKKIESTEDLRLFLLSKNRITNHREVDLRDNETVPSLIKAWEEDCRAFILNERLGDFENVLEEMAQALRNYTEIAPDKAGFILKERVFDYDEEKSHTFNTSIDSMIHDSGLAQMMKNKLPFLGMHLDALFKYEMDPKIFFNQSESDPEKILNITEYKTMVAYLQEQMKYLNLVASEFGTMQLFFGASAQVTQETMESAMTKLLHEAKGDIHFGNMELSEIYEKVTQLRAELERRLDEIKDEKIPLGASIIDYFAQKHV